MPRTLLAAVMFASTALAGIGPAMAQDAPQSTAPVATARSERPVQTPAPAPQPTPSLIAATSAPTDDYGYVAWCYGAVSGYVDQYDVAMPEVIRIERAFPTPSTEENISKVYPEQRDAARESLKAYRAALTAAEKASPRAINAAGAQALNRGRAIWNGASAVSKAQLGQFWMGWAPPADCDTRAKTLEAKSNLFGQALSFNATPVPETPAAAAAAEASAGPLATIDDLLATTPAETAAADAAREAASKAPVSTEAASTAAAPALRGPL